MANKIWRMRPKNVIFRPRSVLFTKKLTFYKGYGPQDTNGTHKAYIILLNKHIITKQLLICITLKAIYIMNSGLNLRQIHTNKHTHTYINQLYTYISVILVIYLLY